MDIERIPVAELEVGMKIAGTAVFSTAVPSATIVEINHHGWISELMLKLHPAETLVPYLVDTTATLPVLIGDPS